MIHAHARMHVRTHARMRARGESIIAATARDENARVMMLIRDE